MLSNDVIQQIVGKVGLVGETVFKEAIDISEREHKRLSDVLIEAVRKSTLFPATQLRVLFSHSLTSPD